MDWQSKETHRMLGAWFNGLYAMFNLAGAAVFLLAFGGFGLIFAAVGVGTFQPPLVIFGAAFAVLGALITAFIAVPFLANFGTAIGLAWYPDEMWTTVVGVVGALIALPVFPIGTLLGLHTLGVICWEPLQQAQTKREPPGPVLVSA